MQKPTWRPVSLDDAAVIGRVGDIARAAGHQDFDPRLLVFLSKSVRRPRSARETQPPARPPGSDDNNIPRAIGHALTIQM